MNKRLGIITDEVSPHIAQALEFAKEQQLGHVEIRTVEGVNGIALSNLDLISIQEEVKRYGLYVSCFSSPVFKCALNPDRPVVVGDAFGIGSGSVEEHFQLLLRAFDTAKRLGTENIRIFSFWREREPSAVEEEIGEHLLRAAKMAKSAGMMLLLENEPACNGGYASEVGRLVRMVDSPALRVLWDPGNEEYGGRSSFPEGYEAVRDVIYHIHLKDARLKVSGEPECVPVGMGIVPYKEQFQALYEDGYKGLMSVETHYVPEGGTTRDGSAMTIAGIRQLHV